MEKKKFTILYVDDEPHNLSSFKATFRREYDVLTADSPKRALEMMREYDVQLVVTDQRMPDMTGVQLLEKILPEYPDVIRIILTGFSDVEAIIEAINSGRVFRYITKPWDEKELRMTIENARQIFELQTKNKRLLSDLKIKMEEQEKTLRLFMKYVPETVVAKALESTEDSIFDGELKRIAVLFCDIRGFTSMSENMSPKETVALLNDYYSIMNACARKHNGAVNQFVGDEIFAVFGAPVDYENNDENAVFCALDMIENLKTLNEKYAAKLQEEIVVGIGINSGEVVAGNLGCEDKIEYSVTGDVVNTGKRIESITKDYPNAILISESVRERMRDLVELKAWEPIAVKGKKNKIRVFEVLGRK